MRCNKCGKRIRDNQQSRRDTVIRGYIHVKCPTSRQSLDEANPVSHDARMSAMGTGITVGQLKHVFDKLHVPDDAKIKFTIGQPSPGWALLESVSFCRPANELSLW